MKAVNAGTRHAVSVPKAEMVESPHGRHARLRPCPNPRCRDRRGSVKTLGGVVYFVYCQGCAMTGPDEETAREAAEAWNEIDRPTVFRVVCGWCQAVKVEGDPGAPVSHGICLGCVREHFGDEMADELAKKTAAEMRRVVA